MFFFYNKHTLVKFTARIYLFLTAARDGWWMGLTDEVSEGTYVWTDTNTVATFTGFANTCNLNNTL